ncbi:hypothetical protein C8A05DRAFT_14273 [Staphylotrichum tortipilum]|uniref:F-box domain-containing protein n=1 Tax=Staphylotrichum tortipilum TaxID=2831512 RepID=A0AAN6RUC9_9PEZI|nr:hypothetical protein C8A05DRAFT_14273 [Staphylotrichum longicolle]
MREAQQQADRRVILRDLQSTIDPLVAAQVYNARYSPLYRLPDELLLLILRRVGNNLVALYCVGQVSTKLRHMILRDRSLPEDMTIGNTFMAPWDDSIRSRLQADGMCDECKLWCRVPIKGWANKLAQVLNRIDTKEDRLHRFCRFGIRHYTLPQLHCGGCGFDHHDGAFSLGQIRLGGNRRQCLGRRGAVRLCGHVTIAWGAVEAAIVAWKQSKHRRCGRRTDYYLDPSRFAVECDHPSHDIRCNKTDTPTKPEARLWVASTNRIALVMSWAPHSGGVTALRHSRDGRPDAAGLRAVFRKLREPGQPAGLLMPAGTRPDSPPEMACFHPRLCRCLRYDTGTNNTTGARARPRACFASHRLRRGVDTSMREDLTRSSVKVFPHSGPQRRGIMGAPCVITAYRRVTRRKIRQRPSSLPPTHDWLHAMDPDTYPHPHGSVLPLCKDKSCMNYYRRPGAVRCVQGPDRMSTVCHGNCYGHGQRHGHSGTPSVRGAERGQTGQGSLSSDGHHG